MKPPLYPLTMNDKLIELFAHDFFFFNMNHVAAKQVIVIGK